MYYLGPEQVLALIVAIADITVTCILGFLFWLSHRRDDGQCAVGCGCFILALMGLVGCILLVAALVGGDVR